MPGLSGVTVVTMLVCFLHLHARLWVHRAPGIPCALCFLRATGFERLGRIAPRECGRVSQTFILRCERSEPRRMSGPGHRPSRRIAFAMLLRMTGDSYSKIESGKMAPDAIPKLLLGCLKIETALSDRNRAVRGRNLPLSTRRAMLRVPIIKGGCGVMSLLLLKFRAWQRLGTFGGYHMKFRHILGLLCAASVSVALAAAASAQDKTVKIGA